MICTRHSRSVRRDGRYGAHMRWVRRGLVVVLGVVVLVTLVGAAWVGAVNLKNSRDESAFIKNLDHSVSGNLCESCPIIWKFPPVDDDFLIAEGDRACAWLQDQPYPGGLEPRRSRSGGSFAGISRRIRCRRPIGARAHCGRTIGPSLLERPGMNCAAMRWNCTSHATRSTARPRPTEGPVPARPG